MPGIYDDDFHRLAREEPGLADVARAGLARTKARGGAQELRAMSWDALSVMKGETGRQARDAMRGRAH